MPINSAKRINDDIMTMTPTNWYQIERTVENWLRLEEIPFKVPRPGDPSPCDFIIEADQTYGLEIKLTANGAVDYLRRLSARATETMKSWDVLLLAMPIAIDDRVTHAVAPLVASLSEKYSIYLITLDQIPSAVGRVETSINFLDQATYLALEILRYNTDLKNRILPTGRPLTHEIVLATLQEIASQQSDPDDRQKIPKLLPLKRQLSDQNFSRLLQESDVEHRLNFGGRNRDVTFVMSDIMNFSKLVRAAQPDDLNGFMSDYYRIARELVWKHGGTFDKFIGDAVLAAFNYPYEQIDPEKAAIQFASDLIIAGEELLVQFASAINPVMVPGFETAKATKTEIEAERERIFTGTRVGIATGEVWILQIGLDGDFQFSFLGDTLNLSQRLESASKVNGVLMDQKTKFRLERSNPEYFNSLDVKLKQFVPKGQEHLISTYQIDAETVQRIHRKNDETDASQTSA